VTPTGAADQARERQQRGQAAGELAGRGGRDHEHGHHEDRPHRPQPDHHGHHEAGGHEQLERADGQAGGARVARVEQRRLQRPEEERHDRERQDREHEHARDVGFHEPRGLAEQVALQAGLVGVVARGDRGEQDDAQREEDREDDADRRVRADAGGPLDADHPERADDAGEGRADHERRRVLRARGQEGDADAGQRGVGERVAHERAPAQHREGAQHAGHDAEQERPRGHHGVGVAEGPEADQRAHASSPMSLGPSGPDCAPAP
jgi:hypothetical protein